MKSFPLTGSRTRSRGFSLMELMVSTAVLSLLLVMVFQMLNGMQLSWKRTKQVVGEFKEARQAFEDITRRVGQATLNAYMSYRYDTATVQGVQLRVGREIIPQS
ncbi:MAG: prepilin-type N-terminal cleavage/methylation domain-containing protein [Verrucomicrobiota bacterium]